MRSTRIGRLALLPLVVLVCLPLFSANSAAATARDVPTDTEAWYQTSPADTGEEEDPTCTLPVGCAPQPGVPVSPYPEKTLHAGIAAGRDNARTFFSLDLSSLPEGAFITGGTLTMPVLTDQESGSFNPEFARLSACPVVGGVKPAQGGPPDQQPEFSCVISAKATYKPGDKPTVQVDLTPIAAMLSTGGIAIVPSKAAQNGGDTWRVVFPAKDHQAEEQITATLTYDDPAAFGGPDPVQPPPQGASGNAPPVTGTSGGMGSVSALDPVTPAAAAAPPASIANPVPDSPPAAQAAPPQPVLAPAAAVPASMPFGYAYPATWLAPLVLAAVAGILARSLTGEIVLPDPDRPEDAQVPGLLDRLLAALRPPAAAGTTATQNG